MAPTALACPGMSGAPPDEGVSPTAATGRLGVTTRVGTPPGPDAPQLPLPGPTRVGRFTVLGRVGEGGMGVVYAAYDELLDRKVALKLLHADGLAEGGDDRLLREAQAMARLSHPNIVSVYEVGSFGEQSFFTYVAAFGAFTAVSYETPQNEKQALGHLAYVLEAMGRLNSIDHYCAHVEYDGGTVDGDFIFGGVSNSTSVAGMVRLRKDLVSLGDGLFETLLIRRPKQFGDLSRIITGVLNQYYDNENVILVQSKNLRFTFQEPVAWTRDGEAGGVTTDVRLSNNHAAIHIIA